MKKVSKVLTALMICGILGFGLSNDKAEASEAALTPDLPEVQELKRPWREPPPPPPRPWGPGRSGHDWGNPPPPPEWGRHQPPPSGHRPPPRW